MTRFAGCTLDVGARRLLRGDRDVHLSPKAFELLKALFENRPRALSKAELLDRVWPGVFVSEASLARAVNEIREAVGDPARHGRVVRTVHGYGYAFGADVDGDAAPASRDGSSTRRERGPDAVADGGAVRCWLSGASGDIALHEGEQVAGRDGSADITLDAQKVSRRHARFLVRGRSVVVEDLASKNGTFVAGARLEGRAALKAGDQIRIGPFSFVLRIEATAASTETDVSTTVRSR
jgi:DNA-binding winged helix-turn-helix (wHTH) protein